MRKSHTVIGVDYGLARIGLATGDALIKIASPLTTLRTRSVARQHALMQAILCTWQPHTVVVGYPCSNPPNGLVCEQFARAMMPYFHGHQLLLIDESFSSYEAEQSIQPQRRIDRNHKSLIDQRAAQIILQSFFEDPVHSTVKTLLYKPG